MSKMQDKMDDHWLAGKRPDDNGHCSWRPQTIKDGGEKRGHINDSTKLRENCLLSTLNYVVVSNVNTTTTTTTTAIIHFNKCATFNLKNIVEDQMKLLLYELC